MSARVQAASSDGSRTTSSQRVTSRAQRKSLTSRSNAAFKSNSKFVKAKVKNRTITKFKEVDGDKRRFSIIQEKIKIDSLTLSFSHEKLEREFIAHGATGFGMSRALTGIGTSIIILITGLSYFLYGKTTVAGLVW